MRDCTCLGTCKGKEGLAQGWRCALEPLEPEPPAWKRAEQLIADCEIGPHCNICRTLRAMLDERLSVRQQAVRETVASCGEKGWLDPDDAAALLATLPTPARAASTCEGGVTVRWCPRCGTCTCPADQSNGVEWVENPTCPIHGSQSGHLEKEAHGDFFERLRGLELLVPSHPEDMADAPAVGVVATAAEITLEHVWMYVRGQSPTLHQLEHWLDAQQRQVRR